MLTLEHIGLLNGLLSIEFLKAFSLGCWNGYFGGRFLSHSLLAFIGVKEIFFFLK
jgi:hypothetical protein